MNTIKIACLTTNHCFYSRQRPDDAGARVEIQVSDNGNGIPQPVIDKIFQPFFTTKPAGLGLSMAYDIITKEHGGSIDIDNREGEGTTFTIRLAA